LTLVDTSVWLNHFRSSDAALISLLEEGLAGAHPFVVGELASGNLKQRAQTLSYFRALPCLPLASEAEAHGLLEDHRLWGLGLGWVDLHLLTAASIAGWQVLTADRTMHAAAVKLRLSPR
jgi:predicted nucleic acid-binding protein